MLLMSQAGMTGGDALVEVLNGTVNPSGKLTDTWPVNFDDNPSSAGFANEDKNNAQELYNDDIFVGYRYYDTFGKDVSYEFGYGGSYTTFAMQTQSVTADKDKVTVKVKGLLPSVKSDWTLLFIIQNLLPSLRSWAAMPAG